MSLDTASSGGALPDVGQVDPSQHQIQLIDLIFGRWRSQILHAGVALDLFEYLHATVPLSAPALAERAGLAPDMLYRLLRALAGLGVLVEDAAQQFTLSPGGAILQKDHPTSLRAMVLLEEGPQHYAAWKYLPALVREGQADGFKREFGLTWSQYLQSNGDYARVFQQAMSSYSANEAHAVAAALPHLGLNIDSALVCDVGGGDGYLLAHLLQPHPAARGVVFDLPEVSAASERHATAQLSGRIQHVGGDMFERVPAEADLYLMKHVVHDWSDEENERVLRNIRSAAHQESRLLIAEFIVTGHDQPDFAKLFDIHMMCVSNGRQRTVQEVQTLLARSGWQLSAVQPCPGSPLSVVMAVPL